jgi:hypothetical protein
MLKPLNEIARAFDQLIRAGHAFHAHFRQCPRLNDCPDCLLLKAEYQARYDRYWNEREAGRRVA